jgi:glycosyltransferase involved in cell wall biosynthesis
MAPAPAARLVSLVVPTLREDGIALTLTTLGEHLGDVAGYDFELLLVDDSDEPYKRTMDAATAAFDARFGPKLTARRVDGTHKGKGAALRTGVQASRGDFVFWMDADLPVPLSNIERFLAAFDRDGADFVVAERPFDRNLTQPVRFIASRALFALQRTFVFRSAAFLDTQCGFKAFRGELARRIAARQVVDGGMADIEYLYAALQSGARPARIAVVPNPESRASKINVKRAVLMDPVDLVRIKLSW